MALACSHARPNSRRLPSRVLALGIGATAAIYSLFDAVVLRPLPYRAPDELAMIWEAPPDYAYNRVAPLNFVDWSEQNHTFAAMAAISRRRQDAHTSRPAARAHRWPGGHLTVL